MIDKDKVLSVLMNAGAQCYKKFQENYDAKFGSQSDIIGVIYKSILDIEEKPKETCGHEEIDYGRINDHFIMNCSECNKVIRVDDWKTQNKILKEFKLSCECGKSIEYKPVKETCKWYLQEKYEEYVTDCKHSNSIHETPKSYKYCHYCGNKIEEIEK